MHHSMLHPPAGQPDTRLLHNESRVFEQADELPDDHRDDCAQGLGQDDVYCRLVGAETEGLGSFVLAARD